MKSTKNIFTSALLAIVATIASLTPSMALSANWQPANDTQSVIKKATANDKVYLSYAPSRDTDSVTPFYGHYSHRSHTSHTSHYSHRSHYSSY